MSPESVPHGGNGGRTVKVSQGQIVQSRVYWQAHQSPSCLKWKPLRTCLYGSTHAWQRCLYFFGQKTRSHSAHGVCFCQWLRYLCFSTSLALLFITLHKEGVTQGLPTAHGRRHGHAKPTAQVPGRREPHTHSRPQMTFLGSSATAGLLGLRARGSAPQQATQTSLQLHVLLPRPGRA